MSTYNDASVILPVSPGYKSTKIYALKPTDGSGDLTIARTGSGSFRNSNGLVEFAATDVPRYQHNVGESCPVLLIEGQSTNLAQYSEDLSNAVYQKAGVGIGIAPVVTTNVGVAPDGTTTADRVVFNCGSPSGSGNESYLRQSITSSATASSFTFYAKSYDGSTYTLSPIANGATLTSITITSEWQRFEVNATWSSVYWGFETRGTFTDQVADVLLWGIDFEALPNATTYIQNLSTGSTTRGKDTITTTGLSSYINTLTGYLFIDIKALTNDLTYRTFAISDGTTTNVISFYYRNTSNAITFNYKIGGVNIFTTTITLTDITVFNKIIFAWEDSNFRIFANGVKEAEQLSGSTSTFTASDIDFNDPSNIEHMVAEVKSFYVDNNSITNAEAITKTT